METEASGLNSPRKTRQLADMRASRQSMSRHRFEHPDRCRSGRARPDGDKQTIHLRHEYRRACARGGRNARHSPISRGVGFKHVDVTGAAAYIDAISLCIDEEIVNVSAG